MSDYWRRPCACLDCLRRDQVDPPGLDVLAVCLLFLVAALVVVLVLLGLEAVRA